MKRLILLAFIISFASLSFGQEDTSSYQWGSTSASYNIRFFRTHREDEEYVIAGYNVLKKGNDGWGSTQVLDICYAILQRAQNPPERSLKYGYSKVCNLAANKISSIYEARNKNDSALYYLYISDTVYPYITDCGNDYYMHRSINACRYADIYEKMSDTGHAFTILLKEALNTETNEHLKKLLPLLSKYDKKKLKMELNDAIVHYIAGTDSFGGAGDSGAPYITFMSTKIYFNPWNVPETTRGTDLRRKTIAYLKNSEFYKMVMSM